MNTVREIPDFFDDNGFLADPNLWNRELGLRIAAQLGFGELEESHWAVIDYLREHYLVSANLPWEGNICRDLDLVEGCVHRLFGGPIEAWKVAGLPDPGEETRAYMLNMEPPDA
jgi:sulfur relay (sulfurtransferase) DsrC/TusE family protein